ncbi:hypothetical protein GCM10022218_19700 [Sphingobacterium ginsenosidimutans]|uniref:Uncharacterized protein n=1 Tax=Sphingobacterium ginsenosidimutans TaxID=687845 RepID=A0ABP8A0J5_9SPHI
MAIILLLNKKTNKNAAYDTKLTQKKAEMVVTSPQSIQKSCSKKSLNNLNSKLWNISVIVKKRYNYVVFLRNII